MDFVVFLLFSSFPILNDFHGRTFLEFLYVGNFWLPVSALYDDHSIDSVWVNQWAGLPPAIKNLDDQKREQKET